MPLRRFTTAERVLTQRRHLERPLLLLILLGAAGFALAEGNVIYLALTVGGLTVNAVALRRRLEVYVPRFIVNAAVLVASGVFLMDLLSGDEALPALGHYLILIQLCKLFEQKRNRDYCQLVAVSLVLMVAGSMITTGLWFALLLAAYLLVACYVVMVLTLKVSLDRQASAHLAVESRPIDPHRLAWNVSSAFPRAALRGRAAQAAAACALAGAAVFLTAPRARPHLLGELPGLGVAEARLTGFSNSVQLREVGRITPDRRVVMRVRVAGDGPQTHPAGFSGYLRARVYETYRKGSWFVWTGRPAVSHGSPRCDTPPTPGRPPSAAPRCSGWAGSPATVRCPGPRTPAGSCRRPSPTSHAFGAPTSSAAANASAPTPPIPAASATSWTWNSPNASPAASRGITPTAWTCPPPTPPATPWRTSSSAPAAATASSSPRP
ncbi:MAG: hypothetical protein AMJ81_14465 [Phycisphaerae bacterium SM23_33]|nr:MAG: hypothetical protein AMJ81_14465 [Phycisphaerae bacterium SM23_33]